MNDRLSLFAEVYGVYSNSYFAGQFDEDLNINMDAGLYYFLKDNIQLDYTFGYGLTEYMYFHSLGLDIMIGPRKDK